MDGLTLGDFGYISPGSSFAAEVSATDTYRGASCSRFARASSIEEQCIAWSSTQKPFAVSHVSEGGFPSAYVKSELILINVSSINRKRAAIRLDARG